MIERRDEMTVLIPHPGNREKKSRKVAKYGQIKRNMG
jgi:hypothetical protein